MSRQRNALNGNDAEQHGTEVPTAYRFGFDFTNGSEFTRRWAAAMRQDRPEPATHCLPTISPPVVEATDPKSSTSEMSRENEISPPSAAAVDAPVNPWSLAIALMVDNASGTERKSGKRKSG